MRGRLGADADAVTQKPRSNADGRSELQDVRLVLGRRTLVPLDDELDVVVEFFNASYDIVRTAVC